MKKYLFLILIPIIFGGCEKTYNNVVDSQLPYQVEAVNTVDRFVYNADDSLIVVSLKVNSSSDIKNIYLDIYSSNNTQLNSSPVKMYDNGLTGTGDTTAGDNIYSIKFPLSRYNPIGLYTIKFFITDLNDNTRQVAIRSFEFDNGQDNSAPLISNLVMPDSIKKGVQFIYYLTVSDSNGINDIKKVFYKTYNPSGTLLVNSQGTSEFPMFDDGTNGGDKTAGDGIYTVALTFPDNQPSGTWKFVFQAMDRRGALSNILSHNIVVQ